jgi:transposase
MKSYTNEFREQALMLSDDIGLKKASEQLGVIYGTLSGWRKQRTKQAKKPESQISEKDQKSENERLRKENIELMRANEVLKDALSFFVKDRKK